MVLFLFFLFVWNSSTWHGVQGKVSMQMMHERSQPNNGRLRVVGYKIEKIGSGWIKVCHQKLLIVLSTHSS